jgi:predicted TPR repeat methyltransferase
MYGLRVFIPGLRRRHQLEEMIGPLGYWDKLQAYQINAVKMLGMMPSHSMLDIGCGPLQGGEAFIRFLDPQKYVGVDLKSRQINAAHELVGLSSLADKNPVLLVSSTFGDRELGEMTFDFIWMSQILYYLDRAMMDKLFEMVSRRMNKNGLFAGDILGPDAERAYIEKYSLNIHTAQSLRPIVERYGLSVVDKGRIECFGYPRRLSRHTNVMLQVTHRE